MAKIRVKNFGPIKEGFTENDGWLEINKVNLFIGDQGSGKSTIAKLISTFFWLEKAMFRDFSIWNIISIQGTNSPFPNKKQNQEVYISEYIYNLLTYHKIQNYLNEKSIIEFSGDYLEIIIDLTDSIEKEEQTETDNFIIYKNLFGVTIKIGKHIKYKPPQITYIPTERNFLMSYQNLLELKLPDEAILTFAIEFNNACHDLINDEHKKNFKTMEEYGEFDKYGKIIKLPIKNINLFFSKKYKILYIRGNNYILPITESASGYQSFVPLYLLTKYLTEKITFGKRNLSLEQQMRQTEEENKILADNNIKDSEKIENIKNIKAKYQNHYLINIVEEPEQNLFPQSQKEILYSLLDFNKQREQREQGEQNKLILTTHSPYFISYLGLAIQGKTLFDKAKKANRTDLIEKITEIVPENSLISGENVSIFQMNEDGTIQKLPNFEGIPASDNFLNNYLGEGNDLFDQLLDIEEEL